MVRGGSSPLGRTAKALHKRGFLYAGGTSFGPSERVGAVATWQISTSVPTFGNTVWVRRRAVRRHRTMFRADARLAVARADFRFVIIGGGSSAYTAPCAPPGTSTSSRPRPGQPRATRAPARRDRRRACRPRRLLAGEFPSDPLDPDQLAQGANFRLNTSLGPLDVMQSIAGIEADPAYPALARDAIKVTFRGHKLLVAGLDHLRAMKIAAGRERTSLTYLKLERRHGSRWHFTWREIGSSTCRSRAPLASAAVAERDRPFAFPVVGCLPATPSVTNAGQFRTRACQRVRRFQSSSSWKH